MKAASEPVLAVEGLRVRLRRAGAWLPVVQDLSLEIAAGETMAIVGESGSGKSVTALALMRLLPPSARIEGRIRFRGTEILGLSPAALQAMRGDRLAMIFQEPMSALNPVLTVGFQIGEALRLHGGLSRTAARLAARRLMDRVRIPDAAARIDHYPHQFSGGMRQRVMIAMAIACAPDLLIADEPTTALDVTVQAEILALLQDLQAESGMAMLFITHDMGVVAEMAERCAVMKAGRLIETERTATLFSAPRQPYTAALLAASPRPTSVEGDGAASKPTPDPPEGGPILAVRDLTTRFDIRSVLLGRRRGRVHAVERVSFELRRGETLAIVGESGSGKTTVGRSLLRLVGPSEGSVELDGENLLALSMRDFRRRSAGLQMVFQDPVGSLNPRRTIGGSIAAPLFVRGGMTRDAIRDRVAELLRQVGLSPDMAGRYPHEFSGGQRQRICLARALAPEPGVVIADEAVSALDAAIKAQIVDLMLDLQARRRLAYLFISHDMAVVRRLAHRVAVMHRGEIVEIGPREAIFGDPQHLYTRSLLAAVLSADPTRRGRTRGTPTREVRGAIHPAASAPPVRIYREVSPGHRVMVSDD